MVAATAATIVALGLWAAYELWTIRASLDSARNQVSELDIQSVADAGGLRDALAPILDDIARAEAHADRPILGLLAPLPVVGDQADGIRAVTDAVASLLPVAEQALVDMDAAIARAADPGGKVAIVDAADAGITALSDAIDEIGLLDRQGLLAPLSGQVDALNEKLSETMDVLADIRSDLATAREVLVGPTRLLLVAANNAEVRGGMGMHLSAGVVTIVDGEFETSEFYPTRELTAVTDGEAELPADLEAMYKGTWGFGREWRTTSTSPNFPVVGDILAQLSALSPFGDVDGVISIDAPALGLLLEATGPVEVGDLTITAENAVEELLKENYIRLGEQGQQDERYELQSEVATAIFDAVTTRPIDVVSFASALQKAAAGRNLLAWSQDPDIQELWEILDADGALTPYDLLVAFQNASASKRDYYIEPEVFLESLPAPDPDHIRVRVRAELTNPEVDPEPWYVETLSKWVPNDVHRAWVTFTLPAAATDIHLDGGYGHRLGSDGPTQLAAAWLRVPVTQTGSVTAEFTLPADHTVARLLPAARVFPTLYHVDGSTFEDDVYSGIPMPLPAGPDSSAPWWTYGLAMAMVGLGGVFVFTRQRRLAGDEPDVKAVRIDTALAGAMFACAAVMILLIIRA